MGHSLFITTATELYSFVIRYHFFRLSAVPRRHPNAKRLLHLEEEVPTEGEPEERREAAAAPQGS